MNLENWVKVYSEYDVVYEAVEHLLKDSTPPLPSIGQDKTVPKHLNPKKATGVDNIPSWCLKRYAEELAPVVHDIVVASIVQCKYPTLYKHAIISPIPKIRLRATTTS